MGLRSAYRRSRWAEERLRIMKFVLAGGYFLCVPLVRALWRWSALLPDHHPQAVRSSGAAVPAGAHHVAGGAIHCCGQGATMRRL